MRTCGVLLTLMLAACSPMATGTAALEDPERSPEETRALNAWSDCSHLTARILRNHPGLSLAEKADEVQRTCNPEYQEFASVLIETRGAAFARRALPHLYDFARQRTVEVISGRD